MMNVKNNEIPVKKSIPEFVNCQIARKILRKYGYKPKPLYSEKLISNSYTFHDYGIDDLLFSKEIPRRDSLKFKKLKPFNKDGVYYSIDYRSNNYNNASKDNDNFIFVKLMEVLNKSSRNEASLLKQQENEKLKVKGILSESNPDYLFYIKQTRNQPRGNLPKNTLINAYLLPVKPLRKTIINNLNQIREKNDLKSLYLNMAAVDCILGTYQTWEIYKNNKKDYDFEFLNMNDAYPHLNPDLMMKIRSDYLSNYIKFDSNGEIMEHNP